MFQLFHADRPSSVNPGQMLWNNANRLARIAARLEPYAKIAAQACSRGVPLGDVLRAQFPFWLTDARRPPVISLEFGTVCNLRCLYCATLIDDRPKRFMPEEVFSRVLWNLKRFEIGRVKVLGGEPTLHPKFPSYISRLAKVTKHLCVVTNAIWRRPGIAEAMLEAPVDLIEVSIDVGGKDQYNASRVRGKYEEVLRNLQELSEMKRKRGYRSLINIRLMVRPSNKHHIRDEVKFYKRWADTVMPQHIIKIHRMDYADDVYIPEQFEMEDWPRCTVPFKILEIKWNGEIPLCGPNARAEPERRISLGNIMNTTISEAWNGPTMRNYRAAHRTRNTSLMPACRGCPGI